MTEKRFTRVEFSNGIIGVRDNNTEYEYPSPIDLLDLLNEQEQKIQRWKNLYELKDAEVTARVDALNKVCEYYTSEVLFKSDVDPNQAVKEVINEILNTEVEM